MPIPRTGCARTRFSGLTTPRTLTTPSSEGIAGEIGDTRQGVRLLDIDSPEVANQHDVESADACCGPESTQFLRDQLPIGIAERLENDRRWRDDYGRCLASVSRVDDDVFINELLVTTGHAVPLDIAPNRAHQDRLAAVAEPQRQELGWGAPARSRVAPWSTTTIRRR